MTPQPIDPHLYFKIMNAMCRVMALWFVFVSYVAMLVPILGLVVGALGTRGPEIIPYSLKMMLGFEWASGTGVVALKVRSFRPDLPPPKPGQSTNWWTGDLEEHGGKIAG